MNLIVICSKILNHASDKLGYCIIARPPLRVIFILKIGKVKKTLLSKNPTCVNVQCVMSECVIEHAG
jgi:hypothetical protein